MGEDYDLQEQMEIDEIALDKMRAEFAEQLNAVEAERDDARALVRELVAKASAAWNAWADWETVELDEAMSELHKSFTKAASYTEEGE